MPYNIHLQHLPSHPIAVMRRKASLPELPKVIPATCGQVWNAIKAQHITGAGRHIAVYLDDEMNLEVGVELEGPIHAQDPLIASATPAGQVATTVHFGPYQRLPEAHRAIRQWCGNNGHALAGPNWELYGHWIDAWNNDPSQIRTDIYYLLK
jgi:effector-binding domain-containing protein